MQGRSVRLFLVDGSPAGILTAEIMNWTGHVLVAPRSRLPEALKRPEASRTGVYFLTGDDPDSPGKQRVYIGEGDSVIDRIKAHAKAPGKDFWTQACIVTSKDANLTKAHVRFLESRIIELAKAANRFAVANGNDPGAKQLPESDVADMEFFLSQVQVVLPVVGLNFLRQALQPSGAETTSGSEQAAVDQLDLVLTTKKYGELAAAVQAEGEVIILAGSQALAKAFVSNNYSQLRQSFIDDGSLIMSADGDRLIFTKNVSCKSPSAAAAVVLNRNSNGWVEWRVKNSGLTLQAWEEAKLAGVGTPEKATT